MKTLSNKSTQYYERLGDMGARVLELPARPTGDEELVLGLIERRATAVQALYHQFSGVVRRVLIQTLGNDHDVEDLMQDTLITVVERARALRDAQSLRSFVIGVAIRLAKNEIRRRKIRRFVGLETVMDAPLVDPHNAVAVQGARHLYCALDRLDMTARVAFTLRYVHGCDLAETAAACRCSVSTIKRKLARAEVRFSALAQADPVLRDFLQDAGRTP